MRITELKDAHKGMTCYVVGMGPSLLGISPYTFASGGVVLAMNHAIIQVEKLNLPNPTYSMQKDCFCVRPKSVPLLVHELEAHEENSPDYEPRYLFNNEKDFDLEWTRPSVVTAIKIADLFGCKRVKLIACDALSNGDCRRVSFNEDGSYRIDEEYSYYTAPRDKVMELEASIPMEIDWNKDPPLRGLGVGGLLDMLIR